LPSTALALRNIGEQVFGFYSKGASKLDDVDETDVALASLHPSDVISVKVRAIR